MERLEYVTINSDEDLKAAITKLTTYLGPLSGYDAYEIPQTLMASAKILKLRRKTNITKVAAKIDGPGFIIEQLFEYFTSGREIENNS